MKKQTTIAIYLFFLQSLAFYAAAAFADNQNETHHQPAVMQEAEKVLVKIRDISSIPKETKLTKLDSSVFLLNATKDSLLTFSVDFGKRKAHCASGNMKWHAEQGSLKNTEPLAPKDFVVMCFPESGVYNVSVYGLRKDGTAAVTRIVVP